MAVANARPLRCAWLEDLAHLPPPSWLIEDILPQGGLVALCSDPGEGKTFLAIDWALSIASGRDWNGRKVVEGPVVYVIGESPGGMFKRFGAWQQVNGQCKAKNFFVVKEPVQLHKESEAKSLTNVLEAAGLNPSLIVFDTFARCFVGGDENSSKEVGEWVHAALKLQNTYGATVLLLHHLTKKTGQLRGSSAMKGATETVIRLEKAKGGAVRVECERQKDDAPFEPFLMKWQEVPEVNSAVLAMTTENAKAGLAKPKREVLMRLVSFPNGATSNEWRLKVADIPKRSFYNYRDDLESGGFVRLQDEIYTLTELGASAISANAVPLPKAG